MKMLFRFSSKLEMIVAMLTVGFVAIANVSHTIALRYLVLFFMLILLVSKREGLCNSVKNSPFVVSVFVAFFIYALGHSFLLSYWSVESVGEFKSQIFIGALWFFCGLGLMRRTVGWSFLDLVVLAGALLVGAELVQSVHYRLTRGEWLYAQVFTTATKIEFTFFVNLVLGYILVLLAMGRAETRFKVWQLWAILLMMIFVSYHAAARNGMLGLFYLVVSFSFLYMVFEGRKYGWMKVLLASLLVIGLAATLFIVSMQRDVRNQTLLESAKIGWLDSNGLAWRRLAPLPNLSNGQPVELSAYERSAWIRAGLDLIIENPQGYGYGRRAFTAALAHQDLPNNVGHSHSGFIDLGVGLGIPGVILWLSFCVGLFVTGYRAFLRHRSLPGLVLMLIVCGFNGRMLIESVNKDHMLHIFLFMVGALLAQTLLSRDQKINE